VSQKSHFPCRVTPGLAHSSPVIWGDNIYVSSAVSSEDTAVFKHGLYGSGDASTDLSTHRWMLFCYDKHSGKKRWERIAVESVPLEKRHIKSTYANATPATDGRYIITFFGSQGLFAFDLKGALKWQRSFGHLDVGAYDAPEYEWGPASSPVIYRDMVIMQIDTQADDFLIALDIHSGQTLWKTDRDELPSWGTPTVYPGPGREEIITNGANFIRGYDPASGRELWRLGGSSKITAPTPVFKDGIFIVASGRRPEKPIFAIRAGANGDITLTSGESLTASVLWRKTKKGP
jgi:outer membrane protein assembly factor BamB